MRDYLSLKQGLSRSCFLIMWLICLIAVNNEMRFINSLLLAECGNPCFCGFADSVICSFFMK